MTARRDGGKYGASPFGFEDLEAYKEAREFRRLTYAVVKALPVEERYALGQQMRRAAISLTNNIAEGYGRYHWQETLQFIRHSRGSLMELVDDLNVCADEDYVDKGRLQGLRERAVDVLRLINGYASWLEKKKKEA